MPIHPVDVAISHRICEQFDLLMALEVKSGDPHSLQVHPLETMVAGTKFQGNPSNKNEIYEMYWSGLTDHLKGCSACVV